MGDNRPPSVSRRDLLRSLPVAVSVGVAGCPGGSQEDTPTETPSPTSTPDRPNIERQTMLRDKAAVTHVRRTVTGDVSYPEPEVANIVDESLLGRWENDVQALEFHSDLTFRDIRSDDQSGGTYFTAPPESFLQIEYENGATFEYNYEVSTSGGDVGLELTNTDGEPVSSYTQTRDGQDKRDIVTATKHDFIYANEDGETVSGEIQNGAFGSGFIVTPDGYVVTNAHVVGTHRTPESSLFRRIAKRSRDTITEVIEEDYDLSESERQEVIDIVLDKFMEYYRENASVSGASTAIDVLHGTATPDEEVETASWSATIETTGSVYEEVSGERTWGRDIAILKVDGQEPLPTVRLGDSTDLGSGAKLFSIGYPTIGVEELFKDRNTTLEPSLTSGVVSARRTLESGVDTIQTDLGLNPGNSGGPVYDGDGNVVGIATFRPSELDISEVSFALPIEVATGFMTEQGIENEAGDLTTTFEEGLNALWRDDCETVSEKMNAVQEMWSDHPYAEDIIDRC